MIILKTPEQIEKMSKAGKILASLHREIAKMIKPGITTQEIDGFVEKYLEERGASPEQKGYQGYPFAICASVNDEICHGFPRDEKLKNGDIVTIDMVVNLDGWLADSAWSYGVGDISEENQRLLDVTKKALYLGIEEAKVGNRLGDIGYAIQSFVEAQGYSVVKDFVGHGIGKDMHEDPQVLHYGTKGRGPRLMEGMVITIEPMVNTGDYRMKIVENGWTAKTVDKSVSAQYEHTLAITKDGPIVLTEQNEGIDTQKEE
ncbi:type I methionyl aminopeptidase [Tissierella creatinophila]|uniref:Methionine aminopeptidase n=1 Tax=Tissierella creatinophila DSM 6911 TaxID=1123403 RepID=A0A1U7M402_TISCR|nr:type I methionyl aminopeptidase [Tissierella creatinophila]OLS02042.1 methionine aminopeptidase 1 [Tissierella creatinophila DSM 6911]